MNHKQVRRWVRDYSPLIDAVSAAVGVFSASCKLLAAHGPDEQLTAIPPVLNDAGISMTATLDQLAAAPRIPDMPLDLMMAGAIGKLRRCTGNPVSVHLAGTCLDGCEHTELEDWADQCVAALKAWNRFKIELPAA